MDIQDVEKSLLSILTNKFKCDFTKGEDFRSILLVSDEYEFKFPSSLTSESSAKNLETKVNRWLVNNSDRILVGHHHTFDQSGGLKVEQA